MPSIRMGFQSKQCRSRESWPVYQVIRSGFSYITCRSAIIFPQDKQVIVHDGSIELQGWAYSGGGNWVERVEVSPDG